MTRRRPGPLLAALLLALTLVGCSGDGDSSDGGGDGDESGADQAAAAEAATALAAALASGDLTGAPLAAETAGAAATSYDAVVADMGGVTPTVAAGDVRLTEQGASAQLRWSWPLTSGKPWTYAAPVTLTQVGEEWQAAWSPALVEPSLTAGERLAVFSIGAERGDIVGARALKIVTPRPVVRLGLDRTKVPLARTAASARRLAVVADIDPAAYVKRVEASGPKSFVEAEVYRQSEAPPKARYAGIPGAVGLFETAPLAPTADFASPLLGTVGEVTAELIADNPGVYEVGDRAGLSGLQARYDAQLRGQPGAVVDAVPAGSDGDDGEERELVRLPAVPGKPLRLSLDVDLQTAAESILADTGPASGLVAIRPSTGDVLVAANGLGAEGVQISTYGQAAPGSTFKAVSSLALLRAGLTVDSTVSCPSTVTVDGKPFKNYSDYPTGALGDITLRQAVANSCNTAFIGQRGKIKPGALAAAAASLGLGIDHDLGFPAYFGQVPDPAGQTEAAADLIGQGGITASPMVMATVIASIQQGKTVVPRLIDNVAGLDTDVPAGVTPLTPDEGESLRSLLHSVVTDGSGQVLADIPGSPIIAKTGTAEFEADGRTLTHAWMIAAQDDLAVCVYVDRGASGSRTAGPLLEAFLRRAAELTP